MPTRRETRIRRKNGKRLTERGVHRCVACHVKSRGWTYTGMDSRSVWARCPACQVEQVVGEVK